MKMRVPWNFQVNFRFVWGLRDALSVLPLHRSKIQCICPSQGRLRCQNNSPRQSWLWRYAFLLSLPKTHLGYLISQGKYDLISCLISSFLLNILIFTLVTELRISNASFFLMKLSWVLDESSRVWSGLMGCRQERTRGWCSCHMWTIAVHQTWDPRFRNHFRGWGRMKQPINPKP